jgi:copper chaperone CopZ
MRIRTRRRTPSRRLLAVVAMAVLWLFAGPSPSAAQTPEGNGATQAVVTVKGLQCPFCAYGIQKQLKRLKGVTNVEVELEKNQAIVTIAPDAKVTDADIERAVRRAGFTPGKIERRSGEGRARPTVS